MYATLPSEIVSFAMVEVDLQVVNVFAALKHVFHNILCHFLFFSRKYRVTKLFAGRTYNGILQCKIETMCSSIHHPSHVVTKISCKTWRICYFSKSQRKICLSYRNENSVHQFSMHRSRCCKSNASSQKFKICGFRQGQQEMCLSYCLL